VAIPRPSTSPSGQGLTSYHPGWRWQITPALPPATDPAGDPLCFIDEWRCVPIAEAEQMTGMAPSQRRCQAVKMDRPLGRCEA
jgi:hypothetical protein